MPDPILTATDQNNKKYLDEALAELEKENLDIESDEDTVILWTEIGEKVRLIRKRQRMSLETLAEKTDLSMSYLTRLERGQRRWNLDTVAKIVKALGVDMCLIFSDTKPEPSVPTSEREES